LVKICMAVAPIVAARGGALCVPPAIEMCAPSGADETFCGGEDFFDDDFLVGAGSVEATFLEATFLEADPFFAADRVRFATFLVGTKPLERINSRPASANLEMKVSRQ
jgi:hypothetical protein